MTLVIPQGRFQSLANIAKDLGAKVVETNSSSPQSAQVDRPTLVDGQKRIVGMKEAINHLRSR